MLIRARNAPLDIIATPNPEVLLIFPPHLSHTRSLRLRSLSASDSDIIRHIFSWEAPVLGDFGLFKTLGTEDGVLEPIPTSSTCYSAPFIVLPVSLQLLSCHLPPNVKCSPVATPGCSQSAWTSTKSTAG